MNNPLTHDGDALHWRAQIDVGPHTLFRLARAAIGLSSTNRQAILCTIGQQKDRPKAVSLCRD